MKYDSDYTRYDSLENSVSITFSRVITIFLCQESVYEQKNSFILNYLLNGPNYTKYDSDYTKYVSLENSVSVMFSCVITMPQITWSTNSAGYRNWRIFIEKS